MSLSTSSGSDPSCAAPSTNCNSFCNSNDGDLKSSNSHGQKEDKNSKMVSIRYPRKKRIMRQRSSNPYLGSSELSPDEQSHHGLQGQGTNYSDDLYSGGTTLDSDVFFDGQDQGSEDSNSSNSNDKLRHVSLRTSFPMFSDFTTNSDDSDLEYEEKMINKQNETRSRNDIFNHHTVCCDYGNNNDNESFQSFNALSLEDRSYIFNEGEEDNFSRNHIAQCPHHQSTTYESQWSPYNSYPEYDPNHGLVLGKISTPQSHSPHQNQRDVGNVQLRREKDKRSCSSFNGIPQSREINSWGHFSKPTESHYKYRRSHYNSSDSDEDNQRRLRCRSRSLGMHHVGKTQQSCLSHSKFHDKNHPHRSSSPPSLVANSKRLHQNKNWNDINKVLDTSSDSNSKDVQPHLFKDRFQVMKRWFAECNDGQKNVILKGFLKLCELPQLHLLSVHMSRELHHGCPSNCEDILTWLPRNLATKVMSYLDPVSLCSAAQVCSVWRSLAEDQSLWRRFCCQAKWRLSKAAEHKQVISHMSMEGSIQWKHVFAERFRLRNNWLRGRCTVRTFEGHHQGISCVQFDESRIVSGSSDKTIKVWNMRTNAPWSVQTLMGHHGTVRCLHLEGNRLVSGSCDCTIKVWDLSTDESWSSIACKVTMTGHTDTVRCLQADDDKVISGSYDKTLKIWDLKSGELRQTLRGHQGSVLCVHFSETKIVSGSVDKTIKVWNYEGLCVNSLCGHQDAVTCLMFDSTRIVSGSLDHNLKFWDVHSGDCLNTIDWKMAEGHTGVIRCLQADSWRVVSAGDDKTIKVWNLATGERLVTLRNHSDGVTCLQFNDFIIVSGSYDKTVKLWDFSCC